MQHFWLDFVTLFDDPAIPPHDPPRVFLVPDAELPRYQPWALALMDAQLVAAIKLLDIELPDLAARLYSYILPLVWISLKALRSQPTFLLGVNGMQGSGKTTLGLVLAKIYAHLRISYEMISLDNFYLPFKDREDLPKKYYWFRGPPGSHSVDLLQDLFRNWRSQQHDKLQIPKFDKSKKQAQGDRCGLQQIDGRAKIYLLEGWMLAYKELDEDIIKRKLLNGELMLVDDSKLHFQADFQMMQFMNKQLRKYEPIWKQLDYIIVLEPENFFYSYKWRLEAEQKVYKTTGYGMADEQVLSMVSYYWKCLHPKVYFEHLQCNAKFILDVNRQVVDCKVKSPE